MPVPRSGPGSVRCCCHSGSGGTPRRARLESGDSGGTGPGPSLKRGWIGTRILMVTNSTDSRTGKRGLDMSLNIHTVRCEALFASTLQGSEQPSAPLLQDAITQTVRRVGSPGGAPAGGPGVCGPPDDA